MNAFSWNALAPHPSIEEALDFLAQMANETNGCPDERMTAVREEIQNTETWQLTDEALQFG